MSDITQIILAICIGVIVGISELLTRYPGNPKSVLRSLPSLFYITINGLTSWFALYLLNTFSVIDLPTEKTNELQTSIKELFIAGLAGMALLRASIMTLRVSGQDVSIGPAAFVQIFLNFADRGTDRHLAHFRASIIADIINGIDFDKASDSLPTTCFTLMANVSAEEQKVVGEQVGYLKSSYIPNEIKCIILGLRLMDIVGVDTLKQAISIIKKHIEINEEPYMGNYYNPPEIVDEMGRELTEETFEKLQSLLEENEILIGRYQNRVLAEVAIHVEDLNTFDRVKTECLKERNGTYAPITYYALEIGNANEGLDTEL